MSEPTPFDAYIAPARERRGVWRFIGSIIVIVAVWLLWTVAVLFGRVAYGILVEGIPPGQALEGAQSMLTDGSPGGIMAILITFIGGWLGVWAALALFHKRSFRTLFAPDRRLRWNEFGAGFGLAMAFLVLGMIVAVLVVGAPTRSTLPFSDWAIWLIPLAIGIFFQASAEELLFRGYILQQLAVWSRNPIVWAVLPSAFFGMLHLNPAAALETNLLIGAITAMVGVTTAALVWRTGSLAMAMGLHVGVNLPALTLFGADGGQITGAQLFLFEGSQTLTLYTIDMVGVLALLALVLSPWFPFKARVAEAPAPIPDRPAE